MTEADLRFGPLSPKPAPQTILESSAPELGVVCGSPGEPRRGGEPGQQGEVSEAGRVGAAHLHTPRSGLRDLREEEGQRVGLADSEANLTGAVVAVLPHSLS